MTALTKQLRFPDLEEAGVANNHTQLKELIEKHGFPRGRWLSPNTHVWDATEVKEWLASRPVERPSRHKPAGGETDLIDRRFP